MNLAYDSKSVSKVVLLVISLKNSLDFGIPSMQQKCELNYFKALVLLTW